MNGIQNIKMKNKTIGVKKGEVKRCRFCLSARKKLHVHSNARTKNGVTYYSCQPCSRERHAEWYAKNKKKQQEYNKNYKAKLKKKNGK